MALFDFDHPFFDPLWRRIVVVVICVGWGLFEFASGAITWGMIFTGIGGVAAYHLLIARRNE